MPRYPYLFNHIQALRKSFGEPVYLTYVCEITEWHVPDIQPYIFHNFYIYRNLSMHGNPLL